MHTQVVLINGERISLDMSWVQITSTGPGRLGELWLEAAPGVNRIIPKASIMQIFQFTDDAWEKAKKEAEAQREAQRIRAAQAAGDTQPWWKRWGRKRPDPALPSPTQEESNAARRGE